MRVRDAAGILLLLGALMLTGCAKKFINDAGSRQTTASHGAVSEETKETEGEKKNQKENEKDGKFTCTLSEDNVLTVTGTGRLKNEDLYKAISGIQGKKVWYRAVKVIISDGITEIGDYCFDEWYYLREIEIPDSVRVIGERAFDSCDDLKEIRLPSGVTTIKKDAFFYCKSLKRLTLPENLEHYAKTAIRGCSKLEEIENRSAHSVKLFEGQVAGEWYCEGKHAEELPAGKTAKIRSITYHITYDLTGGTATEPLPTEYKSREGIILPTTVKKEGYSLAKWHVPQSDELGELVDRVPPSEDWGNIHASAVWIKLELEQVASGTVRVTSKVSAEDWKDFGYDCVRYSPNEDMSDWEYVWMPKGNTGKITGLEKGKTYYVEYLVFFDYDSDDYESDDELPWQGKRSFTVTY